MFRPDLLANEGIENFNDWVAQYGEIVTALEVLPEGGGFQTKSRLSTFKNLPELLATLRSFTQIHSREELKLPSPPYTEHTVVSEPTKWQRYFFKTTIERAQKIRTGETKNEDNFLAIVGDATRSAISIKTVIPIAPRETDGKLSLVAKNVADIYNKTQSLKGVQLIFCDTSTPGLKQKGYDAYNDIKTFLLQVYSIPESEIAFIHDYKSDVAKQTLFRKLRAGAIRICFGSTMKMGTGTNVQTRIVALHDVDIPWTPKDLEQRLGRGVRQGNLMDHVDIYRYTTKGSFDVFRLETVKRKAKAFAKAMSHPRLAERTYSEDTAIDYDTIIAESTNNPIIREKAQIESKLLKMVRRQDQEWGEFQQRKSLYDEAIRWLPDTQEQVKRFESIIERIQAEFITVSEIKPEGEVNDFNRAFYRMAKFKCEIFGEIPGVQGGDTTYLNFNHANQVFKKILENCNGRKAIGSLMGETLYIEPGQNTYSMKILSFADKDGSYISNALEDNNFILNNAIKMINNELTEKLLRLRRSLVKMTGTLEMGLPVEPINRQSEIEELKTDLKRVEAEIAKLKPPKEEKVPPIPLVLEAFRKAIDKELFDPNTVSIDDVDDDEEIDLSKIVNLNTKDVTTAQDTGL